jgi:hypothetical protein
MNDILESPKPISCRIKDNTAHAVFLREDLRHYLNNTNDTILWVEDAEENRAPIRVGFLQAVFVKQSV